jgi:excisionase family DNA binding protein
MTTYLYLTTAEAAARCGVKRVTILAWLRRGHLTGHKFGRDWRLLALAVDACAAARKTGRPRIGSQMSGKCQTLTA